MPLPLEIIEAIEEAGYPLPSLDKDYFTCKSKQERYRRMESDNNDVGTDC